MGMFHKPLFIKSLRDHARGVLGWTLGIVAIVVIQLSVYPTIRDSSAGWSSVTESFPEAFKEIFRMTDYTSEAGYLATELLTFVVPFIFIGMGCSWGARVATEDEEKGAADIALGLPISRASYLVTRMASSLAILVTAGTSFFISLAIGARLLDMSISLARFAIAALCLTLLAVIMLGIATALGALTGRRSVALGVSMAIAIALFITYSLAPLVDVLDSTTPFNPMQWTIGSQPLTQGLSVGYSVSILAFSAVFFASSFRMFERRDIGG